MFKKFVIAYDHRVTQKYIDTIKKILDSHNIDCIILDDDGSANDYPILAVRAHEIYKKEKADGMILLFLELAVPMKPPKTLMNSSCAEEKWVECLKCF